MRLNKIELKSIDKINIILAIVNLLLLTGTLIVMVSDTRQEKEIAILSGLYNSPNMVLTMGNYQLIPSKSYDIYCIGYDLPDTTYVELPIGIYNTGRGILKNARLDLAYPDSDLLICDQLEMHNNRSTIKTERKYINHSGVKQVSYLIDHLLPNDSYNAGDIIGIVTNKIKRLTITVAALSEEHSKVVVTLSFHFIENSAISDAKENQFSLIDSIAMNKVTNPNSNTTQSFFVVYLNESPISYPIFSENYNLLNDQGYSQLTCIDPCLVEVDNNKGEMYLIRSNGDTFGKPIER